MFHFDWLYNMDVNSTDALPNETLLWTENYTTAETHDHSHSLQTYGERVVVAVFILLIAITNVVGNSMVILAVVFSKKLRTPTNALVASLSVADLLAGLAASMTVVGLLNPGDSWAWSTTVPCVTAGVVLYVNSTASLFNLASIALNRAILIKRPMTLYRRLYTRLTTAVNIAVVWIAAIAVMTVPPLFGIGGFGYDEQHHTCSDLDTHPRAKTFERIQTFLSFPIPFLIIVSCYAVIFMHVRRHFQAQRVISSDAPVSASGNSNIFAVSAGNPTHRRPSNQDHFSHQQLKITANLFMAMCAFFVCIAPYSIALFVPNNDRYLLFLAVVFFCNSCINPIVYGAKHPQFKKVMRRMLRCQYSQIEEPSHALKTLMNCCRKLPECR